MSIRSRYLGGIAIPCLLLTLLAPVSRAAEEALPVRFRDDFSTDTRKDYATKGDVTWQKGALSLGKEAEVSRKLELGYSTEVRAVLRWDKGQRDGLLILRLADAEREGGVGLRLVKGRTELVLPGSLERVVALDGGEAKPDGASAWVVRLDVSYGLLQARAWHQGTREPADWQCISYLGEPAWRPQRLRLATDSSGGGSVDSWRIRGVAPLRLSEEQQRDEQRAVAMHQEMVALYSKGQYAKAVTTAREVLTLLRKALPPLHPHFANSLSWLGKLLYALGRHDEARKHLEEALAICRKALPPLHPLLARSLNDLGVQLHAHGRYDEARKHYEEALAIYRKSLPPLHPGLAQSLGNLGATLRALGRHDEARKHLEEALAIRRKALPPLHPDLAISLNSLGVTLYALGCHDEARKHLEEALAIRRKALPPLHPAIAPSLMSLGVLLHAMGRHDEARKHLEEALAICRKALPPLHPRLALTLHWLGLLLQEMGENEISWRCHQESAAIQAAFMARTSAGSPQRDHAALAHQGRSSLYQFLSLAEQSALSFAQRQQVLTALLDSKSLSGTVIARQREAVVLQQDLEAVKLLGKLRPLRLRLADLLLQGPGALPPQRYREMCDQLQREQDDLERDLALRVKGYAELRRSQQATPHELAARLAPGAALVELVRYRRFDFQVKDWDQRWGDDHYLAVLLWRDGGEVAQPRIRVVRLGEAESIDQAIHAWRAHAQQGTIDDKSDRELRQRLWEPLSKALPEKTTRLFIAPDCELALLPFEAIREADGKYLVERLHVSYVTTGRDLMPRPQPEEKPDLALVLADPDYNANDAQDNRLAKAEPAARQKRNEDAARQFQFRPLESLPGFAREAQAVQKLLKDRGWHVQSHYGADASEETLRSASRPRLLYCITHGFFLEDRPRPAAPNPLRELALVDAGPTKWRLPDPGPDPRLASGLALAGANRWQERAKRGLSDGLLTALEAEELELWGTELVVLSACETGRGQVQVGEGVLGLRRAFQQAGARTVLASLWKVPDQETEQLMTAFLRGWLEGAAKSEALRQAQLELIRRLREGKDEFKRAAPPLFWAAFICHGQPK
jgi:CHAT domain-containing protein/Flp pilus assembly protein TadD